MAMRDYKCTACGYTEEFIFSPSVVAPEIPEACPKCGKGKMEYEFNPGKFSFDVIGGYDYQYGKKSNLRGKSTMENPY